MVRSDHLGGAAATVLSWFWDLDTRVGGYTRRGVRGWARREDVEAALKVAVPELLPRLRDRGFLDEEHVHVPGTRAVAVYRITGLGDLLLARAQNREARPPWPPGEAAVEDDAVHLPPGASSALRLLREVLDLPSSHAGVGPGWRTEDELRQQLHPEPEGWDATDTGPWLQGDPPWMRSDALLGSNAYLGEDDADLVHGFDRTDLVWLERAAFVERLAVTPPKRKRTTVFWRATRAGVEIRELIWHPMRPLEG